jgi:hypothetical protein
MTGYLHPAYAESLSEFGKPRLLSRSEAWILERGMPGCGYRDAMGCYPLFACRNWAELRVDLEELTQDLVSLAVVTDPFGAYDANDLRRCFKDVVTVYKQHFVVDLSLPVERFVSTHHRRNARKALQQVQVEQCSDPRDFIGEWTSLYDKLIERHRIQGIAVFSKAAFDMQLRVPGMIAFRADHRQRTVGMTLWCVQDSAAYYHLGAYDEMGYRLRASFALFRSAFEYLAAQGIRWLSLGAGAGVTSRRDDGLSRFKRGWSSGTRTAYLCGRILQPDRYRELAEIRGTASSRYFPAYREGEFR